MKTHFVLALLFSCLFIFQACFAETISAGSNILSLKEALDLALKNNHHIKSALATLPVAEASLIIAKYIPNPVIVSNSEAVKGGSFHPAELWQTLELGRKRHWRIQVAKEQISKTELEISKTIWEIHTQVHVGYADLVIGNELYRLAKERTEFYKNLTDITEKKFKAGDVSKLELERAKLELLSSENNLSDFKGKLKKAEVEFNHLLGNEATASVSLKDSPDLTPKMKLKNYPSIENVLGEALSKRLEIAILERDYGIARAQLKKAKYERIPNLQIGGGAVRPSYRDGIWGPFFGAQFEVPVFNRKQGEIKQAKAQIEYLQREEERIKHDISIDVINSVRDLEVREEQLFRFKEKLISGSENILDMIKIGYKKGKLSLTDVLNAEQTDRNIKQKYLESLYDYQFALSSLEYAVGVPLYGLTEN